MHPLFNIPGLIYVAIEISRITVTDYWNHTLGHRERIEKCCYSLNKIANLATTLKSVTTYTPSWLPADRVETCHIIPYSKCQM